MNDISLLFLKRIVPLISEVKRTASWGIPHTQSDQPRLELVAERLDYVETMIRDEIARLEQKDN